MHENLCERIAETRGSMFGPLEDLDERRRERTSYGPAVNRDVAMAWCGVEDDT